MLLIFAWAYGERTKCRKPIPWRLTSSKKTPCPWTSRLSSLRGMLWPAQPRFVSVSSTMSARSSVVSLIPCRLLDRLDDVDVAGAPADIALDGLADLRFARVGIRIEEGLGRHQHPRRAVAALQCVRVAEGLLQRMQFAILREPLDRLDRSAVGLDGEHHAALDRIAVVEDGARSAIAGVAAHVRAGEIEVVA